MRIARVLLLGASLLGAGCAAEPPPVAAAPPPPPAQVVATPTCRFGDAASCAAACGGADGGSCNNLGAMYELGTAEPRDVARASALYAEACADGAREGCVNLARVRSEPPQVAVIPSPSSLPSPTIEPQGTHVHIEVPLRGPAGSGAIVVDVRSSP